MRFIIAYFTQFIDLIRLEQIFSYNNHLIFSTLVVYDLKILIMFLFFLSNGPTCIFLY